MPATASQLATPQHAPIKARPVKATVPLAAGPRPVGQAAPPQSPPGIPYRFGSVIDDQNGTPDMATIERLKALLQQHFPAAAAHGIDHAWCGIIGVPRDWCATVGLDRKTGLGWAGGYVGVGVSTANLAGRTLADLAKLLIRLLSSGSISSTRNHRTIG